MCVVSIEQVSSSVWFVNSAFSFDVATSIVEAKEFSDVANVMAAIVATGVGMDASEIRAMVSLETRGSVATRINQAKKLARERSTLRRFLSV